MIRTIYRNHKGSVTTDLPETHLRAALLDQGGLLWVDAGGEPPEKVEPLLSGVFGFHRLAVDDALQQAHVPKVDDWGAYLYAVLHGISYDGEAAGLTTHELDVFLGANYLVTHHRVSIPAADRVWAACPRDPRYLAQGPDHLLYLLIDMLVADYMPAMDHLDEAIDQIEDEIFARPTPGTINRLFTLKRAVLHLRRIVGPQREVLNKLARDDYAVIDARDRIYFRDVYDHLVRLADLNESLRDLVGGALDTYLSVTSNRINEVMKILTVVTVLFMPMGVVTGFFGMNFEFLPWAARWLFFCMLALMVSAPAGLFVWFRRRGWL